MSAAIGAMIVQIAEARGVPPGQLTALTGFDPACAADREALIPVALEEALWEGAARLTGDETFGVHAATMVRPGTFDVMDYAVRTAPTLRVALERLVRYNCLVHDAAVFTLIENGPRARIEHAFRVGTVQSRHSAEFTIAALLSIGAHITATPLEARAVEFRHAAPSQAARRALHEFFGVEPRFSMRVNAIEIDATALGRGVPAADPALFRIIEEHAESLLAKRPEHAETSTQRARRKIADALREGTPTIAEVAKRMKMSERSLQRRLADEGVTFDALLDELRRDLALRYLADRNLAVAEIAYLLGFSDPSPFHRAFKRWTGTTPAEARAGL
jgi:AraC-like DNA-binding protein